MNPTSPLAERLHSLKRKISPRASPIILQTSFQNEHNLKQRAEIQLQGLLNEPEEPLECNEKFSMEEVSKRLNIQPFITERLINAVYPSIEDKILSKFEVQKLTRILNSTIDVRALVFFMILDEDNDRYITNNDLSRFYENRLQEMIKKYHLDQKPRIDFEEFYSIVSQDSILLKPLSQVTVHSTCFIKSPLPAIDKHNRLTIDYIKDNLSRIVIFILYLLISLILLLYEIIYRTVVRKSHFLVLFARIGGILLNFNCALVIVLMLKRTILLIRSNKFLRKLIPVDDHIDFHKLVGRVIAGLAILHSVAHMANFGRLNDHPWTTFMFTVKPKIGWVGGFASLSGIILCVILIVIVICSMQCVRRGGHFEIFYWTHLLYLPFFILLILHAEHFWKWIIGPLSIFLLEKIYSLLTRYSSRNGRTYLRSVTIEQSNVISLTIHRPKNFTFKPGDYIGINLPRVALYEFHPFTISSAPEESDYLRVHIQVVGNWTKQVYQRFDDMSEDDARENQLKIYRETQHSPSEEIDDNKSKRREIVVINGPYSSCARYVFDCKHVVLIGGGIGITPYASILSSLMAQFRASRTVCKHCNGINYNSKGLVENYRLKKVDFIWVNRDPKNFQWFLNLLHQFEQEQEFYLSSNPNENRFLDIHLYFTEIVHDETTSNIENLQSKIYLGRPKWDELFQGLIPGNDVNIFFCGPSTMARTIRNHCTRFRFRFYEEKF